MKRLTDNVEPVLSDRERILTTLIDQLSSTQLLGPGRAWASDAFESMGLQHVHFAYWDEPKAGDLVLAKTGHVSRWKVGFYVEPLPGSFGGAVIREIGSNLLCNYANESFVPIRGLSEIDLLEGDRRQFYIKVLRAFAKGDEYLYRFGGLDFDGDEAVITIRESHGGLRGESHPFTARMAWTKRTSIKAILAALRAAGYGTRDFRTPTDPQEGR